jgi:hypothetical protein
MRNDTYQELQNGHLSTIDTSTSANAQEIANLILPTMGEAMTPDEFAQKITGVTLSTLDSVSRQRLLDVFNELDGNGNGILEKSRPSGRHTQGVNTTRHGADNNLLSGTPTPRCNSGNTILSGDPGDCKLRQQQQLQLLNAQLNAASQNVVTGQTFTGVNGTVISSQTVNNNMLQALNKIVYNTKLIVDNTSYVRHGASAPTHSGHPTTPASSLKAASPLPACRSSSASIIRKGRSLERSGHSRSRSRRRCRALAGRMIMEMRRCSRK